MCNVKAEDAGEIRFVARDVESTAYLEVEGKSILSSGKSCFIFLVCSQLKSASYQILKSFSSSFRAPRFHSETPARSNSPGETPRHP